jgi:hypothetical protein
VGVVVALEVFLNGGARAITDPPALFHVVRRQAVIAAVLAFLTPRATRRVVSLRSSVSFNRRSGRTPPDREVISCPGARGAVRLCTASPLPFVR